MVQPFCVFGLDSRADILVHSNQSNKRLTFAKVSRPPVFVTITMAICKFVQKKFLEWKNLSKVQNTLFVVRSLFDLIKPYRSSDYWLHHFIVSTDQVHCGVPRYLWLITTEHTIIAMMTLYYVAIYLWPPAHGQPLQLILFDLWAVNQVSDVIKLEMVASVLCVSAYSYIHFSSFRSNKVVYNACWQVMNSGDCEAGALQPMGCPALMGNMEAKHTIRKRVITVMRCLHLLILGGGLFRQLIPNESSIFLVF